MPRPKNPAMTEDELVWVIRYFKKNFFKVRDDDKNLAPELEQYRLLFLLFKGDRDLNKISKALEFCTDKKGGRGDIYGKSLIDLSDDQFQFLEMISDHVKDWLRIKIAYKMPRRGRIRS